jgi:hypothetical protein
VFPDNLEAAPGAALTESALGPAAASAAPLAVTNPTVPPPTSLEKGTESHSNQVDTSMAEQETYLTGVLEQVCNASNSSKTAGMPRQKAHSYSPISPQHQNGLLKLFCSYVESVMSHCSEENLNPAVAFRYLQGKLPVASLTGWQAFCQLRGVLRACGMCLQVLPSKPSC